jgi:hypothetical protein
MNEDPNRNKEELMSEKWQPTPTEIRIRALDLAATRRQLFGLSEKGEVDRVAEQVLSDARRYADWIEHGDEAADDRAS